MQHSHNFVHRDLKSDNVLIMLSEEDEVVNAVISDYDASFSMDDVDRGRTMIGTPGYVRIFPFFFFFLFVFEVSVGFILRRGLWFQLLNVSSVLRRHPRF